MERLTGLNIILWFQPYEVSQEYFCCVLASSVYYLTIAKHLWENFCSTLKDHENHESLAQWVFPHLQYVRIPFTYLLITMLPYILCVAKYYYNITIQKLTSCKTDVFHCLYVATVPVHHTSVTNQVWACDVHHSCVACVSCLCPVSLSRVSRVLTGKYTHTKIACNSARTYQVFKFYTW